MAKGITKEDLHQFGLLMMDNMRQLLQMVKQQDGVGIQPEWLKSRMVRKMLDISPGTLQNLRITGKVRFKKVLGSYYYNKEDLTNLFNESKKP